MVQSVSYRPRDGPASAHEEAPVMWMSPLRIHPTMHESVTDSNGLTHSSHTAFILPCLLPRDTPLPPKLPATLASCPLHSHSISPSSPLYMFRKLEGCDMKISVIADSMRGGKWKKFRAYQIGLILICSWILMRLIRWMYFLTQTSHSRFITR